MMYLKRQIQSLSQQKKDTQGSRITMEIRDAEATANITITDITKTTFHHGKIYPIPNVSGSNVRQIPIVAEDSRSVIVVPACAIIAGTDIPAVHHVTVVNVTHTVTKMQAGFASRDTRFL